MWRAKLAANALASELLARASAEPKAPVPIEQVAHALGAAICDSSSLAHDGRLVPCGDTATILIKPAQVLARRRFTIAHELAHWAVRSPRLLTRSAQAARAAFRSEEVMADMVAGALLIPPGWLASEFAEARWTANHDLAHLLQIAGRAEVSLGATIVRARDELGWQQSLLHWTRDSGRWLFDGEAGVWPSQEGLAIPTATTHYVLTALAARGAHRARCLLPVRFGAADVTLPAEIEVGHSFAAALLTLPNGDAPRSPLAHPIPAAFRNRGSARLL